MNEIENTILIVDFEATCDENEHLVSRQKMEIIEIGAVKVRLSDFKCIDQFQSLVRPVRTPVLTEFCKKLTGIQQHEVDKAATFYEVAPLFLTGVGKTLTR
ncbi:exonuclease domain-containing protein [Vibrio parahaemolyticus]|nr:exonuclease domain-containing protein [Vibrio parahaemolyticus]